MSRDCKKAVRVNLDIRGCYKQDRKQIQHHCLVLPVCDCGTRDHLPEGGDPNDVLSKDENNNPVWKPISECDCEPVDGLPSGGDPEDVLTKDENNNPVWKPVTRCDCEPGDLLPDGGNPGDYLVKDGNNIAVWMTGKITPTAAQTFYVRVDGDDANSGLADDPESAFKTVNGALINIQNRQHTSPYPVTINIGGGIFEETVSFPSTNISSSVLNITGQGTGSTIIKGSVNTHSVTNRSGVLTVQNFTIHGSSNNGSAVTTLSCSSGEITATDMVFRMDDSSAIKGARILGAFAGSMVLHGNIRFEGSCYAVMNPSGGRLEIGPYQKPASLYFDTVAEFSAVAMERGTLANRESIITRGDNANITSRFWVLSYGLISAGGLGSDWLPGNSAGTISSDSYGSYQN